MPDRYPNFAALAAAQPQGAFSIHVRDTGSPLVVVAPHGGAIEPGTSEIARAIAGDDLSLYLFEGTRPERNGELHLTSTRFDEPRCLALVAAAERVLTIHGENRDEEAVYLGGRDEAALAALRASLAANGFAALEHPDPALLGRHPKNLCNRGRSGAGVQLEVSRGLRRGLFASLDRAGRAHPAPRLARFAAAVRAAGLSIARPT